MSLGRLLLRPLMATGQLVLMVKRSRLMGLALHQLPCPPQTSGSAVQVTGAEASGPICVAGCYSSGLEHGPEPLRWVQYQAAGPAPGLGLGAVGLPAQREPQ